MIVACLAERCINLLDFTVVFSLKDYRGIRYLAALNINQFLGRILECAFSSKEQKAPIKHNNSLWQHISSIKLTQAMFGICPFFVTEHRIPDLHVLLRCRVKWHFQR